MTLKVSCFLKPLAAAAAIIISISCTRFSGNGYSSAWEKYPDSRWAGPDLWANRLADWEVSDGRLQCTGELPLRTVHLMTRRTGPEEGSLMTLVNIVRESGKPAGSSSAAGILLGAGGSLDYRSASLVFHSWVKEQAFLPGLTVTARCFCVTWKRKGIFRPTQRRDGMDGVRLF